MPDAVRLALAFLIAGGATLALTPLAIRLAHRTSFYDHPVGYKKHFRPTPYLGGTAVVAGLLLPAALLARGFDGLLPVAAAALALLGLGTLDDRRGLGPLPRLLAEAAAGGALYAAGVGWSVFSADALNLAFTIVFVVGVVNAYNLMDNLDGATGTVAAVSGAVLGILAASHGDAALGALALALSGACAGFLRFNLTSPARIFLGDGGSMPIGFLLAATVMAMPGTAHLGWVLIPVTVVLVGLPAFDTALVVVSRLRREVGVFSGGRDHLTHRLLTRLGSTRRVALALAGSQAALCGAGALFCAVDRSAAMAGSLIVIGLGIAGVALLESPRWTPAPAGESA